MSLRDLLGMEREIFSAKYDGHTITITEKNGVRTLKCDDLIYSKLDKNSPYTHEYWDFFIPLIYAYDNPKMLMIGLGGGTIAFQLSEFFRGKFSIEIVELDSKMASIYPKFLGRDEGYRIIIGDGAEYVANQKSRYDIIILDAYQPDGKIPRQFLVEKFVEHAYEATTSDGILAVNCIGSMMGPELDGFIQNLSRKFEVYRLNTSYYTANIVLICTKKTNRDELVRRISSRMKLDDKNEFLLKSYEGAKRVFITI